MTLSLAYKLLAAGVLELVKAIKTYGPSRSAATPEIRRSTTVPAFIIDRMYVVMLSGYPLTSANI